MLVHPGPEANRASPATHTCSQVRKHGIHTRLSCTSVNMLPKLVLGSSSEILLEAVSGNTVFSVNSMNRALLLPKPQEMLPFQSLELELAQLLYTKIVFLRMGVVYLNISRHHEFSFVMKGLCIRVHTPINNKITSGGYFSTLCSSDDAKHSQTRDLKFDLPEKLAEVNIFIHRTIVTSG